MQKFLYHIGSLRRRAAHVCVLTLAAFISFQAVGAAPNAAATLKGQLEQEVREFLDGRVDRKRYILYAKVKVPEKKSKKSGLPFLPLDLSRGLQQMLDAVDHASALDDPAVGFSVVIVLDTSVPQSTRTSIEKALQEHFEINGKTRTLNLRSEKIFEPDPEVKVQPPPPDPEIAKRDNLRIQLEQDRLRLDRDKTQIDRDNQKIAREEHVFAKEQHQFAREEHAQAKERFQIDKEQLKVGAEIAKTRLEAERTRLELTKKTGVLKELQPMIVGIGVFVALVLACFILAMGMRRGLGAMAQSITTASANIGESITAKAADANAAAQEAAAIVGEAADSAHNPLDANWSAGQPEFEDYLSKIQDKIDVLSRQKSFAFLREFVDMLEDPERVPTAAAILVALPNDSARVLVQDVSGAQLQKLREFMESEGGLARAKSLRRKALQEFYGKIAMFELTDSPLMAIKDAEWLTRLTSAQLAEFAAQLSDEDRPMFLACLSPYRVSKMLAATVTQKAKNALLRAIGRISQVTAQQLVAFVQKANSSEGFAKQVRQVQPIADSFQYIGAIADDLGEQEQALLLEAANADELLVRRLRNFFMPFKTILKLPKEILNEIFQNRATNQIASMIFDTTPDVRDHVIANLPNIRAEAVRDELKILDETPVYAAKNRKASQKLQKEVCRYMLKLRTEGLLTIDLGDSSSNKNEVSHAEPSTARPAGAA